MRFSAILVAALSLATVDYSSNSNLLVNANAVPSQGVEPVVLSDDTTKVASFTEDELKAIEEDKEVFTFQAEVNR